MMEGRGNDKKHPWQEDPFLFEQMDYIVDRLLAAAAIYTFVAKPNTSHLSEKEGKLRSLYFACSEVNKGEEDVYRTFHGKFTRILKLITEAYIEVLGIDDNEQTESPRDKQLKSSSPRHPQFSHSVSASSPRTLRHSLKNSMNPLEAVHQINADHERHHYARLLGLMLGEIYRLMDADVLPPIREKDKQTAYYQCALMTQLPITTTSEEEFPSRESWYSQLKLRTAPPVAEKPTLTRGKTV